VERIYLSISASTGVDIYINDYVRYSLKSRLVGASGHRRIIIKTLYISRYVARTWFVRPACSTGRPSAPYRVARAELLARPQ